jgi:hypothetical protein
VQSSDVTMSLNEALMMKMPVPALESNLVDL